jgi:hypothetical protein
LGENSLIFNELSNVLRFEQARYSFFILFNYFLVFLRKIKNYIFWQAPENSINKKLATYAASLFENGK